MERIPCMNQDSCRLRDSRLGCREDVHHRVYPRRDYQKGVAREYRELDENKVRICRAEHDEIHATERPPARLSVEEMREAVALSKLAERAIEEYGQTEMAG